MVVLLYSDNKSAVSYAVLIFIKYLDLLLTKFDCYNILNSEVSNSGVGI